MLKEHQPESQNIVIGKMSNPQRYRSWKLQTQKYSYNVPPCQEPQSNFEIGGGGGTLVTQYWGGIQDTFILNIGGGHVLPGPPALWSLPVRELGTWTIIKDLWSAGELWEAQQKL